eukprot:gene36853-41714_t
MAAVVALMAKDKGEPKLRSQVLLWPVTDANFDTPSYQQFADNHFLTKNMMVWFWDSYTKDAAKRKEIYASPLQATLPQLQGLPPTLIQTAEFDVLRDEAGRRHMNTASDAEVLLNVLAHELHAASKGASFSADALFAAVAALQARVQGSYAAVAQFAGQGLLAFRDPLGVRPLCLGAREAAGGTEYMLASESVALEGMGFRFQRDVAPGEAVFISSAGALSARQVVAGAQAPAPAA